MKKDNDYDCSIVTFEGQDGEEIDFIEIAEIVYNDNFYAVLQPVDLFDGMQEDEALVFKKIKNKRGEDNFVIELDEDILGEVFAIYQELLDEMDDD